MFGHPFPIHDLLYDVFGRSWIVIVPSWRSGKTAKTAPKSCSSRRVAVMFSGEENERQPKENSIAKRPSYICCLIFPHTLHYTPLWVTSQPPTFKVALRSLKSKIKKAKQVEEEKGGKNKRNCLKTKSLGRRKKSLIKNRKWWVI